MQDIKQLVSMAMDGRKIFALISCGVLLSLVGCVSPAQQLDDSVISQIQVGMDRKEVVKLLGQPKKTELGSDKISLDEYWFGFERPAFLHKSSPGDFTIRSMEITYGADKKVMDSYSHAGRMHYRFLANGNLVTGKPGADKHLSEIQKSKDHLYNLTDWFGEPNVISRHLDGQLHYHWFFFEFYSQARMRGKELEAILDSEGFVADFRVHENK